MTGLKHKLLSEGNTPSPGICLWELRWCASSRGRRRMRTTWPRQVSQGPWGPRDQLLPLTLWRGGSTLRWATLASPVQLPLQILLKRSVLPPFFFSGVSVASCGDLKQTSCAQQPETRPDLKGLQRTGRPPGLFLLAPCPTISSPGQAIVPTARYPAPVLFICPLNVCQNLKFCEDWERS